MIGSVAVVKANLGDAGKKDQHGNTALMWAAQRGHSQCLKLLLGESSQTNKHLETALILAAQSGQPACAGQLMQEAEQLSLIGQTALQCAISRNKCCCDSPLLLLAGIPANLGLDAARSTEQYRPELVKRLLYLEAGVAST